MSFTELEKCLANTKIWKKDLHEDQAPEDLRGLFTWLQQQLLHNVAPLLEGQIKASMHELGEAYEIMAEQGRALDEVIDQEGDFLQPEMASDLTATLMLGSFIIELIEGEGIKLGDDLKNKKLHDAMKLYRQNTTILLEQIAAVTVVDDDEEEEDTDDNDDDTELHGEGGGPGDESGDVRAGGGTGGVRGGAGGVRGGAGGAGGAGGGAGAGEEA